MKKTYIKKIFDNIFDFVILLAIITIALVSLLTIIEQIIPLHFWYISDISKESVISWSLKIIVLVKMYKLLYFFIWEHKIKLTELIEIWLSTILIEIIFNHVQLTTYNLTLLVILLISFFLLKILWKKGILVWEENNIDKNV